MTAKTGKRFYGATEFYSDLAALAQEINWNQYEFIFGVPQGGVPLALALQSWLSRKLARGVPLVIDEKQLVDKPKELVLVVDDLIDSGHTRERYGDYDFACLHVKEWYTGWASNQQLYVPAANRGVTDWIVYWWEGTQEKSIEDAVLRQLQYIGEDSNREGLAETPARVVRAWDEIFAGYKQGPGDVLTTFVDGACDEMVLLKDVEFYSTCEHHLLPFFGKAHIAYIPAGKVIGVSKLARLLEIFARRLQIQERIGEQVTTCLMKLLEPKGAACILEAQHFCMTSRGVQKQHSVMVTSSLKGVFLEKAEARAELMGLIR